MPTSLAVETIFSLKPHPSAQYTIDCDDAFLSHFAEKYIQSAIWKHENSSLQRLTYQTSQHLAIAASLLSQDLFSSHNAFILTINGTDLKHPPLVNLIQSCQHIPILYRLQKMTGAQKKTKGYLAISQQSTLITTKALSEKKTMTWLQGLLQSRRLQLAPNLILPLCQHLDWDLSSMAQLTEQMLQQNILSAHSLDELKPCILTTHQAPVFTFIDQLFSGNLRYCQQFFTQYQQNDVLQKLYWLCLRRLKQYVMMQESMRQDNLSAQHVLQQARVWPQLQKQYLLALRLPQQRLQNHYLAFCQLEWTLKGLIKNHFSDQTMHVLLRLASDLQPR